MEMPLCETPTRSTGVTLTPLGSFPESGMVLRRVSASPDASECSPGSCAMTTALLPKPATDTSCVDDCPAPNRTVFLGLAALRTGLPGRKYWLTGTDWTAGELRTTSTSMEAAANPPSAPIFKVLTDAQPGRITTALRMSNEYFTFDYWVWVFGNLNVARCLASRVIGTQEIFHQGTKFLGGQRSSGPGAVFQNDALQVLAGLIYSEASRYCRWWRAKRVWNPRRKTTIKC